ncbi:oleoyl-acyl carrier protein thioesterase 1, chloroplastic-like [Glycine soja]|uniref:Acyl-[acyl-carrier-protein] hydrolase n=1 Tax=Glycine soja TaxID=3848 RepID=A0A445FU53_GLYSO|nr:oleoyl-acyl carrier protein thioesterase 1, chloroplastic-like [Glycine soja]RZB52364.1 Oleoyl-acyl carrier protein thioesterase 2, chloroplastic [Glycine soja]
MFKLSCNGLDRAHSLAQCGFAGRPACAVPRRRRSGVSGFRLPEGRSIRVSAAVSAKDGAVATRVEADPGTLADRLRVGSLTEDGLSYKEKFIVRSYEVGINKTATVETIANLLQEVGCNHAQSVGYSTDGFATTPTMRKLRLIWVTARMHIEIYKYPAWSDIVEIETWCQGEGRVGTRRDFILKDYATDEVIGRATSKWVMMNQDTRRLQKVSDDVKEEYLVFCPREPRLAIPEADSNSLKKIPKLEDPAQYSRLGLVPRRADLDMNQHVNNVTYIGWVLESMPQEIIDSHELQSITLDYRRECGQHDIVDSLTSVEAIQGGAEAVPELKGTNGSATAREDKHEHQQFLHLLRLSTEGLEINRGRTEWRKKAPR